MSGVFIETVSCVFQSPDKLSHVIECWTGGHGVLLKVFLRIVFLEEVRRGSFAYVEHQTNEDIYGKTVKVLC